MRACVIFRRRNFVPMPLQRPGCIVVLAPEVSVLSSMWSLALAIRASRLGAADLFRVNAEMECFVVSPCTRVWLLRGAYVPSAYSL